MGDRLQFKASVVMAVAFLFAAAPVGWGQPLFEEVAAEVGLNNVGSCGAVFWADLDGDTDLDLVRTHRFGEPDIIFRNAGNHFTALANIGLSMTSDAGTCLPMDFDRDGDLDIYIDCFGTSIMLMVKDGDRYYDRTAQLGLTVRGGGTYPTWLDINRDGWMDLLTQFNNGWKLYINENGTHFRDVTASSQLPPLYWGACFTETDFDLDGDIDLYTTVINGSNHLYVNYGNNAFVDATGAAGLSGINGDFGCAWVDFDHDKYPDLLTPNHNYHSIWRNRGDGTFEEMIVHGTTTNSWGGFPHGARYAVADFDMDGDEDIYAVRPGGCGNSTAPNQFFRQIGCTGNEIWFEEIAGEFGMAFAEDGFPQWVDYDDDGDLDLYIAQHQSPDRLYRNNIIGNGNLLQVRVLGPAGELDRWHTRVEVYPHGSDQVLKVSELNYSNVNRNGFNNYFVLDENGHYDLRIHFACGVVMSPEEYPQLADVVPAQIGNLLTVYMGQGVDTDERPTPAADFRLEPVYPNPFNATATIRYSVPTTGTVHLAVYDILGRHARDLVFGNVGAGEHSASWDASALTSGLYFVRLTAGSRTATVKAMLIK